VESSAEGFDVAAVAKRAKCTVDVAGVYAEEFSELGGAQRLAGGDEMVIHAALCPTERARKPHRSPMGAYKLWFACSVLIGKEPA